MGAMRSSRLFCSSPAQGYNQYIGHMNKSTEKTRKQKLRKRISLDLVIVPHRMVEIEIPQDQMLILLVRPKCSPEIRECTVSVPSGLLDGILYVMDM